MTRRDWLSATATGLSLSRLALGQDYRKGNADIRLGVASYSFRKFPRARAIAMTKQLGTPYLNVKDFHLLLTSTPEEIAAARKEFAENGIILVGCGTVTFDKTDEADIRHKFEYAKAAGFPLIVSAPTAITLPLLEKYVREFNIKVAVHNHGPEDKNFPTPQSVLKLVKNMDPRCGLCIDVGHTSRTGADVVAAVAEAGPRLLDMHIKDLMDPLSKESQVPVGSGHLPIAGVFNQLLKMNYVGSVNLEYEVQPDDPLPGMEKSFSFMRATLAHAGAAVASHSSTN